MKIADYCAGFDLDITLRDAACDENTSPTRRAIANLCIGMDVDDAYYSVRELREAVADILEDATDGRGKLRTILANRCDDFQRAIYYSLAGRGVMDMVEALDWLLALLEARGRMAARLGRAHINRKPLVSPYVAEEPDGPVIAADHDFALGRSWFVDRGPSPC